MQRGRAFGEQRDDQASTRRPESQQLGMTSNLPCAASLALLAAFSTAPSAQRSLTPAQMEEDLFQLSEEFEMKHSGLFRYTTREDMDDAFGTAMFELDEEKTELEFYRIVSRLVSKVRCGHTRVSPNTRIRAAADGQRGLLPIEVWLTGDRLFVVRSLDGSLPDGGEILSIDGRSVTEMRSAVFAATPGDGFIETGKERAFESQFARYYALLVQQPEDEGRFVVRLAGVDEPVRVDGMNAREFAGAATARPGRPVVALELDQEADIGVLSVSTFGDPATGDTYPELLASAFARVRESGVGHLVLDLRGNGGGDDNYGALLVSYFSPEPFGNFDHIVVTEQYDGQGGIVERDGKRIVTEHPGTQVQEPSRPGFRGEAFVFIDGRTFSTAADVATVMHHNGLATFVGEETGGGYDGNTSGITERHVMGHSGIAFTCPLWSYTTANVGHEYPGRGALPHHSPERTIEDVLAKRDVELDFVRDRIASK